MFPFTQRLAQRALAAAAALALAAVIGAPPNAHAQEMDKMWGDEELTSSKSARRGRFFDSGNYAMFVHWGIYSALANKWEGRTHYGIGEWIMNPQMAGIPPEKYEALARDFNPDLFDARALARLAKDAGMKYIVITSKHHDGFAMYHSKACKFNIVDATPFKRDPMKELADACRELGLGFGFYYSHNQDWTFPGGGNGPATDALGNKRTFSDYFAEKCLPQVNEITTQYGPIELVWFDTPGGMPPKYAKQLADLVHKNQPDALVSGRVGFGLGDYRTFADMEIPLENVSGLWEGVDVTNDSWGYAWYDSNWKTPKQILTYLLTTVARGGTYMLNIGPGPRGEIPEPAAAALRAAGNWIAAHPKTVYGAQPSPWKHALPWGEVIVNDGKLHLVILRWPANGQLHLHGLDTEILAAKLQLPANAAATNNAQSGTGGSPVSQTPAAANAVSPAAANAPVLDIPFRREGNWHIFDLPPRAPDSLANVITLTTKPNGKVDPVQAVDPELGLELSAAFAKTVHCSARKAKWMEKFGEWKHLPQIGDWKPDSAATWEFEIKTPGRYYVELTFAATATTRKLPRRTLNAFPRVWNVRSDEGREIQNLQFSTAIHTLRPIGWLTFDKPGRHTLTVTLPEGDSPGTSLSSLKITPGNF